MCIRDSTAREAIESQYSLDTVKDGDGNYTAPSADVILSYVRNKILLDAAEDEGITVSSKEMKKYAEDSIGTSDYKTCLLYTSRTTCSSARRSSM